ncbi:MAG: hypothetical protein ABEK50_14090, partial [bacterium]
MKRLLILCLSVLLVVPTSAGALEMDVSGVSNVWGLSQNNFFFGANNGNDNYVVQMHRLNAKFSDEDAPVKAITRLDLAQGWWGVDNAGDKDFDGGQFYNKNTFFDVHVDHAYLEFDVPDRLTRRQGLPEVTARVGRMHYALGNKLVLDDDVDGLQFEVPVDERADFTLGVAKFTEGDDGADTNANINTNRSQGLAQLNDNGANDDANMVMANYTRNWKQSSLSSYYTYYYDNSYEDGTAYITQGLGYHRPRFTPQVTQLNIVGLSGSTQWGNLHLTGEIDYLVGKDEVDNDTSNFRRNDVNNGDLEGYTAYGDLRYDQKGGNIGLKVGIGSGDEDPTKGEGNITKLKTQGFFYFTEIWEDSIMPDVGGITPQGLGAPNTQGYREFENTTALQLYGSIKISKYSSLFLSASKMKATENVWSHEDVDRVLAG